MKMLFKIVAVLAIVMTGIGYAAGVWNYSKLSKSLVSITDANSVDGFADLMAEAESKPTNKGVYGCWVANAGAQITFQLMLDRAGTIFYGIKPSPRFLWIDIAAVGQYTITGSAVRVTSATGHAGLFNSLGYVVGLSDNNPDVLAWVDHESAMELSRVTCSPDFTRLKADNV